MYSNLLRYFILGMFLSYGVVANPALDSRQKTFQSMAEEIQIQMKKYAQNMGTKSWTYETAAKDLVCQNGSLMKLLMQRNNERYRHHQTDTEIKEKIADELADILSLVIFIADELDIDLTMAWQKMLKSDQQKIQKRASKKIK